VRLIGPPHLTVRQRTYLEAEFLLFVAAVRRCLTPAFDSRSLTRLFNTNIFAAVFTYGNPDTFGPLIDGDFMGLPQTWTVTCINRVSVQSFKNIAP
jgi:hypothetical protein